MIIQYQNDTSSKIPVWYEKAEEIFTGSEYYKDIIGKVSETLKTDVSWRFPRVNNEDVGLYILDRKKCEILFTAQQAKSLVDFCFPLSQLLNYRWAQLLKMYNNAPRIASKVKGISDNKLRRNNLTKYKNMLLQMYDSNPVDFYTGEVLNNNDISVDHVIPWSFMYSDDIWNLVLTSRSNNSTKSNSTPSKDIIEKLKERNIKLLQHINNPSELSNLEEAIKNNYLDKYYAALKIGI